MCGVPGLGKEGEKWPKEKTLKWVTVRPIYSAWSLWVCGTGPAGLLFMEGRGGPGVHRKGVQVLESRQPRLKSLFLRRVGLGKRLHSLKLSSLISDPGVNNNLPLDLLYNIVSMINENVLDTRKFVERVDLMVSVVTIIKNNKSPLLPGYYEA